MLTLDDFMALNEPEKAEAIWAGSYLAGREEDGYTVQLYSLDNFWVEVFYDTQNNKINRFEAFTSKKLLVPYLAQIRFNQ